MKVGIIGRKKDTYNYEKTLHSMGIEHLTTLTYGELTGCQALILPGGGDITPSLFGQPNLHSQNIDTELDLLQLHILRMALKQSIPILGICKGMQLINVALGGTLLQHLPSANLHTGSHDLYHETTTVKGCFLDKLYGQSFLTNSRHHQAIDKPASQLIPIQWCNADNCIEAICHETLPVFGVQWHPERLNPQYTTISCFPLFQYFLSFV